MKKEIIYDGTDESILKIIDNLPWDRNWIRREGTSITIPTPAARQVFIGEVVVIEGKTVTIVER